MEKKVWLKVIFLVSLLFVFLFLTGCVKVGDTYMPISGSDISGPFDIIKAIWYAIVYVATLKFIKEGVIPLAAFMRLVVGILLFTVLYGGAHLARIPRNMGITLSLVITVVSAVFIPDPVLITIGASYGTIVSLALVGIPLAGGFFLLRAIPTSGWWIVARIAVLFLMVTILSMMSPHVKDLLDVTVPALSSGGP